MARELVIIGAESTGKSTLAARLGQRSDTVVIPERLRSWCMARQRTPRMDEQHALFEQQIDVLHWAHRWADARGRAWIVIDAGPWMTALYSHLYFGDESLWEALRRRPMQPATLVWTRPCGFWTGDPGLREGPQMQERIDTAIAAVLDNPSHPGWIAEPKRRQWVFGDDFKL